MIWSGKEKPSMESCIIDFCDFKRDVRNLNSSIFTCYKSKSVYSAIHIPCMYKFINEKLNI